MTHSRVGWSSIRADKISPFRRLLGLSLYHRTQPSNFGGDWLDRLDLDGVVIADADAQEVLLADVQELDDVLR